MALARGSSAGALPKGTRPAVRVGMGKLRAGLLCWTGRRREGPSVQPGPPWCSLWEGILSALGKEPPAGASPAEEEVQVPPPPSGM